jgi:aspartate/tyrosine/aromatic aminotransferase
MKSIFSHIPMADGNKLFDLAKQYQDCKDPNKVNLAIGQFRDEKGELIEFECVRKSQEIVAKSNMNKEYAPIGGMPEFIKSLQEIFFIPDFKPLKEERILFAHLATGGASLKLGSELIQKFIGNKIYVSNETFGPYYNLFSRLEIKTYPYYKDRKLDIDSLVEFLRNLEDGSVISLQISGHNPTSLDPSKEEWDRLAEVMAKKKHIAYFDVAYLGYASGCIQEDLYPVYKFADLNIEQLISYSSAKNFTTYSDDIGALIFIFNNKDLVNKMRSHYVVHARSLYSFGPLYGSRIINKIMESPELKELWLKEQKQVYERIADIRKRFIEELEKEGIAGEYIDFLRKQKGIYIYLDISNEKVDQLAEKFHIYTGPKGRINATGITEEKFSYIAKALKDTLV